MIDLPKLAERIEGLGIMRKPFFDLTLEEVQSLVSAVMSCPHVDQIPADGWGKPRIEDGELIVPFDAHPSNRWWEPGGKSIEEILQEANAPQEMIDNYRAGLGLGARLKG